MTLTSPRRSSKEEGGATGFTCLTGFLTCLTGFGRLFFSPLTDIPENKLAANSLCCGGYNQSLHCGLGLTERAYEEKRACNSQCILCMRHIIDESAGYAIFSHDLANGPPGNKG